MDEQLKSSTLRGRALLFDASVRFAFPGREADVEAGKVFPPFNPQMRWQFCLLANAAVPQAAGEIVARVGLFCPYSSAVIHGLLGSDAQTKRGDLRIQR
jgi:hypothetical protein